VKVLLIPLAIIAFILFLLVLGAIGLGIALGIIWVLGRIGALLTGRGGRRRGAGASAQQG
jgi:hypothetical protein